MKKSILSGFALISIALLINLNVNAGDWHHLKEVGEPDGGGGNTYKCSSGGVGSTSCSVSVSGGGGGISGGTGCSVTCSSGYYACCNAYHNKCQCRKS